MTDQINLLDGTTEFMRGAGQPIPAVPTVPADATIALRLAMLAEEVAELCEAIDPHLTLSALAAAHRDGRSINGVADRLQGFLTTRPAGPGPNLEKMSDAYNDICVVSWGGNLETCGVTGAYASAHEVARSNVDKVNGKHGPTLWAGEPFNSKVLKPIEQGWQGPDIAGALRQAGADL